MNAPTLDSLTPDTTADCQALFGFDPGFEVAAPWLVDAFGGRQSARSLHFICAWGLAGFVALHLFMVLWSGPVKQIGRMITGGRREGDTNA